MTNDTTPAAPPKRPGSFAVFVLGSALFLGANLATASRSPVVWQDEVMFADPAVNLASGHGFTTSAWFQPRTTLFAGNSPLYSLALAPWVAAFGVSAGAVRSLNYALVLAAVWVLAAAAGRLGLVRSAAAKLGLAALVLCGDGVTFSFRSGRYDCLGMLVAAGMFAALGVASAGARGAALFGLAAVVPWAGLQLVPYTALLAAALLGVRGRRAAADVAAVSLGGAAGSALLFGVLKANGVWGEFVRSVAVHGSAGRTLGARAAGAASAPLAEASSVLLLAALGVLVAAAALGKRRGVGVGVRPGDPAAVGLLAGLAVPGALAFAGKYPRYYAWMAFVPMAVCLASALERGLRHGPGASGRSPGKAPAPALAAAAACGVLAALAGLPARLAVTALEWDLRDPAPVDRMVAGQVGPADWVFTEYEAYYPSKRAAGATFLPPYIGDSSGAGHVEPALTAAERDRVDVLITKPGLAGKRLEFFGGRWAPVAHYAADPAARVPALARAGFGSKPYDLTVYRRRR